MIRRSMNADFFTYLANHPEIRPWVGGGGELSFAPLAEDPSQILIEADNGGWWLHPILPGVYELHTMFLPEGRGKTFFAAARAMFRYVFVETDALEVVTKCPDDNDRARMAANLVGFRERFRRDDAWAPGVGISYRVFSVDDWLARDREIQAQGQAFHAELEAAKSAAGRTDPQHADDEAHDRAVGAALLMIRAGQADKAVALYNRWAVFASYAPIARVGPNLFDVRDGIVEVSSDGMRALTVRAAPA